MNRDAAAQGPESQSLALMTSSLPTPPPFHATVEPADGEFRVRFAGELDLATVREAEDAVAEARRGGAGPLVLDLGGLTFVDSSGLRLIMQINAACASDG